MATVTRQLKTTKYVGTGQELVCTDVYLVEGCDCGNPFIAQSKTGDGLPYYRDFHPDILTARVIRREAVYHSPNSSMVTCTYSNDPSKYLETDGAAVRTYDLMGRTERQPWDIVTEEAIGANFEGAEVYRPALQVTYEHRESTIDPNTWYSLTGKTNDDTWKGFAQGTMLFLGARARSDGGAWNVTYMYLYHPNFHLVTWRKYTDLPVGDEIVRTYEPEQESIVYEQGDFDDLPI